jgi:hypothetical protein
MLSPNGTKKKIIEFFLRNSKVIFKNIILFFRKQGSTSKGLNVFFEFLELIIY